MILSILLGVAVAVIIVVLAVGNARFQQQIQTLQHDRDLLEAQNTGPQGVHGKNATQAQVDAAVAKYCAAHDECRGPKGVQGVVGKSVVGPRGLTGSNGDSVASVRCNGTSVSFLDAKGKVLGTVRMVCLGS